MVRKATSCGLLIALCLIVGCKQRAAPGPTVEYMVDPAKGDEFDVYVQQRGERLVILKRRGADPGKGVIILHLDRLPVFTDKIQLVPKLLMSPQARPEEEPCECERKVCDPMCYGGVNWPTVPAPVDPGPGSDAGTGSDAGSGSDTGW